MAGPISDRRGHTVLSLDARVRALEERAIIDAGLHTNLERADSATALAVTELTRAINDPRTGLIVELGNFRQEVAADRRVFRAWIAGASAIVTAATVAGPWIRGLVEGLVR